MSESKHTPGPWKVFRAGRSVLAGGVKIYQSIGPCAASVNIQNRIDAELRANAQLIAAAPEMLQALELVEKWMLGNQPNPHSDSVVLDVIGSAIKKAKGE